LWTLLERFRPKAWPFVGLKPEMDRNEAALTDSGAPLTFGQIVDCLADAGLLSSGTHEEGSLRSYASGDVPTESDIELVAERLRDFRLRLGPNTMDRIRNGADSIPLSGGERHEVAHAALFAVKGA
jgi:hypothetical protein